MKQCGTCKQNKQLDDFSYKNKKMGTRQSVCKQCHRDYSSSHYNSNKSYYIKKSKINSNKQRQHNKNYINILKLGLGCKYCNECDPACLDFHHIQQKSFTVSTRLYLSTNTLQNEIEKCDVVCSNCHRKLHANQILIPRY